MTLLLIFVKSTMNQERAESDFLKRKRNSARSNFKIKIKVLKIETELHIAFIFIDKRSKYIDLNIFCPSFQFVQNLVHRALTEL